MSTSNYDFQEQKYELVSGYVDGELTQQEAQKVALMIETDPDYRQLYDEISVLRHEVQGLSLQEQELEHLDRLFEEPVVKTSRIFGLALIFFSSLALIGVTFYLIFSNPDIPLVEKILVGLLGGGSISLLVSVLRQRLMSAKTDKYKRVKI